METAPSPDAQITGSVLLYHNPEPLSVERHARLGLQRLAKPFEFAAQAHAVPIQVTEFAFAARSYPIIFGGDHKAPLAVMSIRQNENLFITEGVFEPDIYIPAFIRRYPFVLANNEVEQQLLVCIDRPTPVLVEGGDVPLFEDGKLSAFAQQMVDFCGNFESERLKTEQFIGKLKELDLFESKQATFTPATTDGGAGEPIVLADYFAVSEEKLAKLTADGLLELHRSGALRQIYAHLDSMLNWERLLARSNTRPPVAANA